MDPKDMRINELTAVNAGLVEALKDAEFRLFGQGPSTDPLHTKIRDALHRATERG